MKRSGKCPKCGCTRIIADAKAIDLMHLNIPADQQVGMYQNPDAMFFKKFVTTTVSAWVCVECG